MNERAIQKLIATGFFLTGSCWIINGIFFTFTMLKNAFRISVFRIFPFLIAIPLTEYSYNYLNVYAILFAEPFPWIFPLLLTVSVLSAIGYLTMEIGHGRAAWALSRGGKTTLEKNSTGAENDELSPIDAFRIRSTASTIISCIIVIFPVLVFVFDDYTTYWIVFVSMASLHVLQRVFVGTSLIAARKHWEAISPNSKNIFSCLKNLTFYSLLAMMPWAMPFIAAPWAKCVTFLYREINNTSNANNQSEKMQP